MGLDLHVLPISAYVVGDYERGMAVMLRNMGMGQVPLRVIRAGGDGPATFEQITAPSGAWGQLQRWTGIWALRRGVERLKSKSRRAAGLQYVQWLRDALRRVGVENADWCEEGGSALTRQFPREHLYALRAYAWRLEFPDVLGPGRTGLASADERHDSSVSTLDKAEQLKLKSSRFPHLCNHESDSEGYYIPVGFDVPRWILDPETPEGGGEHRTPIASSVGLMKELAELNATLDVKTPWVLSEFMPRSSGEDDDLREVRYGWILLEGFARTSVEKRLPICFDG
jgi:hypothetical protein